MAVLCLLIASLLGCSSDESDGIEVSRDAYGEAWPLTVDEGVLHCIDSPSGPAVTLTVGPDVYAMNGTALSHTDASPVDPIWADDGSGLGLKKPLTDLLGRGSAACD